MAKNIILLSDGTGNSSISPSKSNVWRLFDALDLGLTGNGGRDQIAFYDDGVGTSGSRPIKLLGGAFGWGLSRNVRELYESLSPDERLVVQAIAVYARPVPADAMAAATAGSARASRTHRPDRERLPGPSTRQDRRPSSSMSTSWLIL